MSANDHQVKSMEAIKGVGLRSFKNLAQLDPKKCKERPNLNVLANPTRPRNLSKKNKPDSNAKFIIETAIILRICLLKITYYFLL